MKPYIFIVNEVRNGNDIVVSAEIIPSPREPYLVKNENPATCPLCSAGLHLKHTDVLILSQFLRSDGCILPRRVTGLCRKQQKYVSSLIIMAQKAGKCYRYKLLFHVFNIIVICRVNAKYKSK